jgi:hypothetical protein
MSHVRWDDDRKRFIVRRRVPANVQAIIGGKPKFITHKFRQGINRATTNDFTGRHRARLAGRMGGRLWRRTCRRFGTCSLREAPTGTLINATSGQPFIITYADPCVERNPHVGFDGEATAAVRPNVAAILRAAFKLAKE